ncbi:MAG TPA: TonB-dependent receptor plug domain-containing protein, partial [Novosphingobium sp.]|nr:TonB-dependent receptor plug domain-containing protein [Novosphingobium sp.]
MTLLRSVAMAAVSAIAIANAGLAHAAGTDTASTDAADDNGVILVTAQHRSENLQNVPLAVSVVKGETLEDYHANGADTLLSLSGKVPSLYVESTTGRIFPRFYIRGLGNTDYYLGASQPVSIIQDDVVEEHVVLKSTPAFDIGQVEVLKGPQGSLFGRNTTAGIIKFESAKPTEYMTGDTSISWGSHNSMNVESGVGGPLSANHVLKFRLSSLYQQRSGWISNTYAGISDDGTKAGRNVMGGFKEGDVRLQLQLDPEPATSINLSTHYRNYSGSATIFYRGSIQKGTSRPAAGFNYGAVQYDEGNNNPQAYTTWGQSLHVRHDFGGVSLTSITAYENTSGYSRGDTDGGAGVNNGNVGFSESMGRVAQLNQWSQELRLANSDKARLKWQLGGLYFDSRDDTEFYQRAYFLTSNALGGTPNPNNWVMLHNINTSWAVFGQASYKITDKLTISAGARETNDTK